MTQDSVFVDRCDHHHVLPEFWESILISKEDIDAEIERLASIDKPADGRRQSLIAHPSATEPGLGLAPGIQVTLTVLKP